MNLYCRIATCSGTSSPCDLNPHIKSCFCFPTEAFQMDIVTWMVMAPIHLRLWTIRMRLCMWNSIIRYIMCENHFTISYFVTMHLSKIVFWGLFFVRIFNLPSHFSSTDTLLTSQCNRYTKTTENHFTISYCVAMHLSKIVFWGLFLCIFLTYHHIFQALTLSWPVNVTGTPEPQFSWYYLDFVHKKKYTSSSAEMNIEMYI